MDGTLKIIATHAALALHLPDDILLSDVPSHNCRYGGRELDEHTFHPFLILGTSPLAALHTRSRIVVLPAFALPRTKIRNRRGRGGSAIW